MEKRAVTSANPSVDDPTTGGTGDSASTGSLFGVRDYPNPTVMRISGNQKSRWASSPGKYIVLDAGSGGR